MKNKKNILIGLAILFIGLIAGWIIKPSSHQTNESSNHQTIVSSDHHIWTCSMHPQIRQNEPGACPICGMDLIPLETTDAGEDPGAYQMSENAMRLANVQTMKVGRGDASREIRLNGKVQVDERNTYSQTTHIPGRIEQLSINFTGESVSRGQTLATVYSPEMVTAQQELLQAARIRESQPELFEAAKEKLRNWRIGEAQIEQIIAGGQALQRFPIRADVNGIVTQKMVDLGDYVERGMPLYEISDLSKVWILFDLYESQLGWVKEGSKIEFTVNSIPGETFAGTISFVDPLLNPQTRVATARVEVDNRDRRLKPEMFATGVVKNNIASGASQEIVIPKSAVLWTGRRSIVYVKTEVNGRASFALREITLGPSLGDSYVVQDGLEPGEEIVSNGTFTVDAAVQLSGRPSMMNPDMDVQTGNHSHTVSVSQQAKTQLNSVVTGYMNLKDALVEDNTNLAQKQATALLNTINSLDKTKLQEDAVVVWESYQKELQGDAKAIANAANIGAKRERFDELSYTIIGMVKTFGLGSESLYVLHCPMANNDKGADWLSASAEIRNPYYGSSMLKCGEVKEAIK